MKKIVTIFILTLLIFLFEKNACAKKITNVSFKLYNSLNPYNYTITLKSSRILLKSEIHKSKIYIKKGKKKYSCKFYGISKNGRYVTYKLSKKYVKKFVPQNGKMNGKYKITSSSFNSKITFNYKELYYKNSITGFVLSKSGNPLSHSKITCLDGKKTISVFSDKAGKYTLKNITYPKKITVSKSGYITSSYTNFNYKKGKINCENFILKKKTNTNFIYSFAVKNSSNSTIANAKITLFVNNKKICSGVTNSKGNLLFFNKLPSKNSSCNKLSINPDSFNYIQNYSYLDTSNKLLLKQINTYKDLSFLIEKDNYISEKITITPDNYLSNLFFINVNLKSKTNLSFLNLSLKLDTPLNNISSISLDIFENNNSHPILKTSLDKNYFYTYGDTIFFKEKKLNNYLPSGNYYLRLYCDNLSSAIIPISINNGFINKSVIRIYNNQYTRFITYIKYTNNSKVANSTLLATFDLYENVNNKYFYVGRFNSSIFQGSGYETKQANLLIKGCIPGKKYSLFPVKNTAVCSNIISFSMDKSKLFLSEEICLINSPQSTIPCLIFNNTSLPKPNDSTVSLTYNSIKNHSFTKSYIRNHSSYPNKVTVYLKSDGSFLYLDLYSNRKIHFSTNNSTIVERFENGHIFKRM